MGALELFFGKKRRVRRSTKKSVSSKPKRGRYVKSLSKSKSFVTVRGRKRKLYRGKNGGLYYRTKSGRKYIETKALKRRGRVLSPKKRRVRRVVKKLRRKKLKQTAAAVKARRAYRLRKQRRARFGLW